MTAEFYEQVEHIYHSVLKLPPENRSSFLMEACDGNEELRSEVMSMLKINEQAHGFLSTPVTPKALDVLTEQKEKLLVGRKLGHYKVLSAIGAGGMGEVYLAEDTALGRKVALKILPIHFTRDEALLSRFVREARTASALNHPNILTIYEIGEAEGIHFIATEFVEGLTLRQQLIRSRLEPLSALNVATQVAAALGAAHQAGIVHRDIKPENIMLRPDGLVKVLDFGLATMVELQHDLADSQAPTQAAFKTEPGMVMGTPRYMSPEQARGKKADARTDIFSLGVVLYEMICGKPPFPGKTPAEIFAALLEKEPASLSRVAPDLPDAFDEIIAKALAKKRKDRYQSAAEVSQDLEFLKNELRSQDDSTPTLSLGKPVSQDRQAKSLPDSKQTKAAHWGQTGESARITHEANAAIIGKQSSSALWRVAILMVVALAVGFGIYKLIWSNDTRREPSEPPKSLPLTSAPGSKDHANFSPDGSQIVFSWDGGKGLANTNRDIYTRFLGIGAPLQLTRTPEDEVFPAWSPDGRFIAFQRRFEDDNFGIYIIPANGSGNETRLAEGHWGVFWSPDSKTLAISSRFSDGDAYSIFLLSVETREKTRLTTVAHPYADAMPRFSPDGKKIAFIRRSSSSALDIFVVPVSGGTPKQLTNDKRNIFGLTWTADSQEIIFATNRGGVGGLWRIPATGGTAERVLVTGQNPTYPAISPQNNRLAYTDRYTDSNLYLYEGSGFGGRSTPGKFGEATLFISSTREDTSPQFSPDGEKIVFTSQRTGSEEVWICNRDGSNQRQLTNFDGRAAGTPRWSPDGKWIAFDSRFQGSPDVYVIGVDGSGLRRITTESWDDSKPSWSADGNWIYFASNRNGRSEIWKMPASGGEAVQLTRSGGFEGFETPDGKLFYFSKGRGTYGIWSITTEGTDEKPVPELAKAGYWRSWGLMKEGIYFMSKEARQQQTINFFSFATRQITPLATTQKEALWWEPGLTISRDGRHILFAQMDFVHNEIWVIENFR